MFGCGPKYLREHLKLEHVYKTYAMQMANEFQHKMFKTTHNSVNISPTQIIQVLK